MDNGELRVQQKIMTIVKKQMTRYKALWIGFLLNMVKNAVAIVTALARKR
jgi:hypothetical protein